MGIKAINSFSLKYRFKLLKYVLATKTLDTIPDVLKQAYNLITKLENESINFVKRNGKLYFSYLINKQKFNFSIGEYSSDAIVFKQIIINEEYKIIVELCRKLNIEPKYIIDAGANIGLTSIYLKHFFSDAMLISLEPNKETFKDLREQIDINFFDNIHLINKGLWNKETFLKADYAFRDRQSWAFRLEESVNKKEALFETTSIPALIKEFNLPKIDFLKIDIEGGEKQVFESNDMSWLDVVSIIAIEIHDEFLCRENIENILVLNGFEISYSGELTIAVKN